MRPRQSSNPADDEPEQCRHHDRREPPPPAVFHDVPRHLDDDSDPDGVEGEETDPDSGAGSSTLRRLSREEQPPEWPATRDPRPATNPVSSPATMTAAAAMATLVSHAVDDELELPASVDTSGFDQIAAAIGGASSQGPRVTRLLGCRLSYRAGSDQVGRKHVHSYTSMLIAVCYAYSNGANCITDYGSYYTIGTVPRLPLPARRQQQYPTQVLKFWRP